MANEDRSSPEQESRSAQLDFWETELRELKAERAELLEKIKNEEDGTISRKSLLNVDFNIFLLESKMKGGDKNRPLL